MSIVYPPDDSGGALSPSPQWQITQQGTGQVVRRQEALWLSVYPSDGGYHNAQITDYAPAERRFTLRPPLRIAVEAKLDTSPWGLRGTAGFGLWNHTYDPTGRGFRLPQTAWFFFASPQSDLALAQSVRGWGWKAATLDANRWRVRALLPLAPLAIPLMRVPSLYRRLYPIAQAVLGIHERPLDMALLEQFHRYEIAWHSAGLTFSVDGATVLQTASAPCGPLGFVAWIDNQYAVVTPQGRFGFGLCALEQAQALVIRHLHISKPSIS